MSKLAGWSKGLGYAGLGANLWENYNSVRETGKLGLENVVDMGFSFVGLCPEVGIPLGIGYIGIDYLWYQYSGTTIRDNLDGINLIRF